MNLFACYVISRGDNNCTVAVSSNPVARAQSLQIRNAVPVKLEYALFASPKTILALKKRVQASLASEKQVGEWYNISADKAIEQIADNARIMMDYDLIPDGRKPSPMQDTAPTPTIMPFKAVRY